MYDPHREQTWKPKLRDLPAGSDPIPRAPHWTRGNEVILTAIGSPFDDHHEALVTLRCNEPGVVDLGRLLVSVLTEAGRGDGREIILDELARVESIQIFNSYQKIRGLPGGEAPAGPFSPLRRQRSIDLGKVRLAPGDTIALTIRIGIRETRGVAVAAPFQPDGLRQLGRSIDPIQEPHVILASPARRGSGADPVDLTLTLEEDGVVDLGSLQLFGTLAPSSARLPRSVLAASVVESIRLPSSENLLVGNLELETPHDLPFELALPATVFDPLERMRPWICLGPLAVLRGQKITIRVRPLGGYGKDPGAETVFSAAMSFYPSIPATGKVTPSNLFGPWPSN